MTFDWPNALETDAVPIADPRPDAEARAKQLALLPRLEYEQCRESEAKDLGIRVSALDKAVVRHRESGGNDDADQLQLVEVTEPWPGPVSGCDLAEDIRRALFAHVVFPSEADADAATLWLIGAWLMDAWRLWPKLLIQSPEKRCGKSTLLEVVEAHACRPMMTANITAAALFRVIETARPTLLIDEADRFLRDNEQANGIINAGHTRRTATVIRTVEVNGTHEARKFSVWGAQAIACIGRQMDTLEDRAIRIGLRRRLASESVSALPVDYFEQRAIVRQKLQRWAADNSRRIGDLDLVPPACGNDRAQDNWAPLFRIATLLGDPWPERVAAAYLLKEAVDEDRDERDGVVAIRDLMALFEQHACERLQSSELVAWLVQMEDRPWGELKQGRPITAISLARLLKPFGIKPRQMKFGTYGAKGYQRSEIRDAYDRYCATMPDRVETPKPTNDTSGLGHAQPETCTYQVSVSPASNALTNKESFEVSDDASGFRDDWRDFQ
ncbi:DUF3631 domain-containing protein [Limibaculum sp. FT325]|uniref:DUF3631 domain-containing protein n=1 Tax=Thermohalobaculum sediminis TaxID=2939436 RepID=UPI0020BEBC74|nr:DUF3631 domain-containing protein [Limibaculum sediminis]MCL5776440.1 DUF3631 domain-containing protein [Limibaculum sediminis]